MAGGYLRGAEAISAKAGSGPTGGANQRTSTMAIKIHTHTAESGKQFRKLLMAEVFEALGMPEQAEAGCGLSKDGKTLMLWEPRAPKQKEEPHVAKEMQVAITAWAEHIRAGKGKLADIQDNTLRNAVARLLKPAPIQMPPVSETIQMPPKSQVNEHGPVGVTIKRRQKRA